jgi:hypothetical protein
VHNFSYSLYRNTRVGDFIQAVGLVPIYKAGKKKVEKFRHQEEGPHF